MKVAVISAAPTLGKSTLIELLGGLYSRTQGQDVAVFTTGLAEDNISMITNMTKKVELDNPYIIKSMVDNAGGEDSVELLNYGIQAGDEHIFYYDILGTAMPEEQSEEFLLSAIEKVPSTLTLIEICGDVSSEINKKVLSLCDCSFVLCDVSIKGFKELTKLFERLPKCVAVVNRAIVLAKINPVAASDKAVSQKLKMKLIDIYKFPYNAIVQKAAFNGELDRLIYNIIIGDHEVADFRQPLQSMMEYIFDTPKRKIIRGMDRWYK